MPFIPPKVMCRRLMCSTEGVMVIRLLWGFQLPDFHGQTYLWAKPFIDLYPYSLCYGYVFSKLSLK